MTSTNWLDPNWRQELSNSLIAWVVISVLASIIAVSWWAISNWASLSRPKTIVAGAVVGALAGGVLWLTVPWGVAEVAPVVPEVPIFVECESTIPEPTAVAPGETIYQLPLFPNEKVEDRLTEISGGDRGVTLGTIGPPGSHAGYFARCKFKNYGKEPIFNANVTVSSVYRLRERKSPNSFGPGKEVFARQSAIVIPVIEADSSRPAVIYVRNFSEHFVTFDFGMSADGSVGEQASRRLRLHRPPKMIGHDGLPITLLPRVFPKEE